MITTGGFGAPSRCFDEQSPSYLGYMLRVEGTIEDELGEFMIATGKAAQLNILPVRETEA